MYTCMSILTYMVVFLRIRDVVTLFFKCGPESLLNVKQAYRSKINQPFRSFKVSLTSHPDLSLKVIILTSCPDLAFSHSVRVLIRPLIACK